MNWTQIEGKWAQLKGDAKSQWAKLTDDDLMQVAGRFDNLVGKVVERYGVEKEHARTQVSAWAERVGTHLDDAARVVEEKTDQAKARADAKGAARH